MDKLRTLFSTPKAMFVLTMIGLFLISAGSSWAVFSFLRQDPTIVVNSPDEVGQTRSRIDTSAPKTESCPINGEMFTKAEKAIWESRRPIAAMIENHADSRPNSGLSKADVVYEAVAEGGITRFLNIFYCGVAAEEVKIAPVRSARIYFLELAAGYGDKPIFMHVGGANDFGGTGDTAKEVRALETLETIGWRVPRGNDFDTTYDSGYPVFWRDYERLGHPIATEHTMTSSLDAAYAEAAKRGLTNVDKKGVAWDRNFVPWKFIDGKAVDSPAYSKISFAFWDNKPDYDVAWEYDKAGNEYKRINGGQPHMDAFNNQQIKAKNVIVVYAKETGPVDRNMHMFYKVVGTGKVDVFQNGEVIKGTWEKADRYSQIRFMDSKGKEIPLVKGKTWVEILPALNTVNY